MPANHEAKYFVSEKEMKEQFDSMRDSIQLSTEQPKRKHHIYCIGAPKTGTHSINSIFRNFKSMHEPLPLFMIELIRRIRYQMISRSDLLDILATKDRYLNLEIESSHFNSNFLPEIIELFPKAKFIFLYRDVLNWLDSWINHHINQPNLKTGSAKQVGRDLYYHRGKSHTKYDAALKINGLQSLDSYLEFWATFNTSILDNLPENRTIMIPTENLSLAAHNLSSFANVPVKSLRLDKSHKFKAIKKHYLLNKIDPSYLNDRVEKICGTTISRLIHSELEK